MINILMDGAREGAPMTATEYENLLHTDNGFMFESVTLEELEATYHYDHAPVPERMLEAIVTTTNRLARTMEAFRRAFARQLVGTEISVEEAEIARPRISGGYATQTVRFPVSDGQSVSIIFHSPSGDPAKIAAGDTLVAFRFLLNKRDVTHTVSPDGGIDVSLKQVTLKLSNLLERNSKPFQSRQTAIKAQRDKLDTAQAELAKKDAEYNAVVSDAEATEEALIVTRKRVETFKIAIDKTNKRLRALRAKLKLLQKNTPDSTAAVRADDWGVGETISVDGETWELKSIATDGTKITVSIAGGPGKELSIDELNNVQDDTGVNVVVRRVNGQLTDEEKQKQPGNTEGTPTAPVSKTDPDSVPEGSGGGIVASVPLHSIRTNSMLNPAIKVSATSSDNPNRIWFSQGKPNTMVVSASFAPDFDQDKADKEREDAFRYRAALKAAKEDGYLLERYKHSRLQGIYILVNADEKVLTRNGWDAYWKAAAPNKQPAATDETETLYIYAIPADLDKAAAPKTDFIDWVEKEALPATALEVLDAAEANGQEFAGIGRYRAEIDTAVLLKYKMLDLQVPYDPTAHTQPKTGEVVDSSLESEFDRLYQTALQLPGADMAITDEKDGRYFVSQGNGFSIDNGASLSDAIEYLKDWISKAPARAIEAKRELLKAFIRNAKLPKGWILNKDEIEDAEWPKVFIDSVIEAYSKDGNYSYSLYVNDNNEMVISHANGGDPKQVAKFSDAIEFVQQQLSEDAAEFASTYTGSVDDLPDELAELVKPLLTKTNSEATMNSDDMAAKLRDALDSEKDPDALMALLESAIDTFEAEGTYSENEQLAELVSDRITELLEAAQ